MPTQTVRQEIARDLGPDWRDQLVWLDGGPTAAASIGQVHKGRWHDGRDVAVKVQYPGAGDALLGDLRQLSRLARGIAPVFPGIDSCPWCASSRPGQPTSSTTSSRPMPRRPSPTLSRTTLEIVVPHVVAVGTTVLVTEWMESPASLASIIAQGTREERDHYGELLVRFLFTGPSRTGMLHADPHPGNFRLLPHDDGSPGRLGVLDYGAVARLPDRALPASMGRLMRLAADADPDDLLEGLRSEGFIKPGIKIDAELVADYLAPFAEPTRVERFRFSREWMRDTVRADQQPARPVVHGGHQAQLAAVVPPHPPDLAGRHRAAQPARGGGTVPGDPRGVTARLRRRLTASIVRSHCANSCLLRQPAVPQR